VDVLEGQPHAVKRTRREILHQHVAQLHQAIEISLPFGCLESMVIERLEPLSMVK